MMNQLQKRRNSRVYEQMGNLAAVTNPDASLGFKA
jgi:hypothetical protein